MISKLDEDPASLSAAGDLLGWVGFPVAVKVISHSSANTNGGTLSLPFSKYLIVDSDSGRKVGKSFADQNLAAMAARQMNKRLMSASNGEDNPYKTLLWFHAFRRDSAIDIVKLLKSGITPSPPEKSNTPKNEQALGINPPCVYAYLGRTTDAFGDSAVALRMEPGTGSLSPFDTGGLVKHIVPVKDWEVLRKRRFLDEYSWDGASVLLCLDSHPSSDRSQIRAYLKGDPPPYSGPHELWQSDFQAGIWDSGHNGWQAWTWEMRVPQALSIADRLVRWTCSVEMYADIVEYADSQVSETAFFEQLFRSYVHGGPSRLHAETRALQEAV